MIDGLTPHLEVDSTKVFQANMARQNEKLAALVKDLRAAGADMELGPELFNCRLAALPPDMQSAFYHRFHEVNRYCKMVDEPKPHLEIDPAKVLRAQNVLVLD